MSKNESGFAQLTWDDLSTWAASTSLSRGKSYKTQVQDLNMTKDGGIIAWVQGSELYATKVMIDSSGKLSASCSCPSYWNPCKHSVALVLSLLDSLKSKKDIPEASANDRRFRLIEEKKSARTSDWITDEEDEEDADSEFAETLDGSEEEHDSNLPEPPRRSGKTRRATVVRRKIESMSKDQLVEFVVNLVDEHPEIGARIEEEEDVRSGRISKTVRSIRSEIENLASEPAWENHWSGENNIPDYSHVRARLESLLNSGHADEVLDLGKDLWSLGNEQVESSNDEGETGEQIAECMKVIFRALDKSTLASSDQILWMIETFLEDEFGILDDPQDYFDDNQYDENAWSEVANTLLNRLGNLPLSDNRETFHEDYKRRQVVDWAIMALELSGREQEIVPLLKREAPLTQCYGLLIERLLEAGMRVEAKATAVEGFQLTIDKAPGIAWKLEDKLRRMAEEDKQLSMVAAYRALEFFNHSSLESYKDLEKAAEAVGEWTTVKEAVIAFLQKGVRPDVKAKTGKAKAVGSNINLWPLPSPEISTEIKASRYQQFPDVSPLIAISIYEKDTPEVLRWYEIAKKTPYLASSFDTQVAEAVKNSHPDESLKIWWKLAENQINLVKTSAYEVAAMYLRQMRDVYQKTGRVDEWTTLIAGIRAKHKAKRNLMQILDGMMGKRIIDT
ncbi:MAG: SWIM zinc finger family protein [Desulfomonilaceae bacterium]|jgi:uncharacterized Zn finger protein